MAKLYLGSREITPIVKKDVMTYNVSSAALLAETDANGSLIAPTSDLNFVFTGVKEIATAVLDEKFYGNTRVKSVSFPDLKKIKSTGSLYNTFFECSNLTSIDISSVEEVSDYGFEQTFTSTGITGNLYFTNLKKIGENSFYFTFGRCSNLVDAYFTSLEKIEDSENLFNMFADSGLKKAYFTVLSDVSTSYAALVSMFSGCKYLTDVYFNSLKTTSFGQNNTQFNDMLYNTGTSTTHTLHFPSNLQSTISGLYGYPLFGGSSGSVVLAFDLPATP